MIRNLGLFAKILSEPALAADKERLFHLVAQTGGHSTDVDNLTEALCAFGFYNRSMEFNIAHDLVCKRDEAGWLLTATEHLYGDLIAFSGVDPSSPWYESPKTIGEVRNFGTTFWGYETDEASKVTDTLRIVSEEIVRRTRRKRRASRIAELTAKLLFGILALLVFLALGFCASVTRHGLNCDWDVHGQHCD